MPNLTPLAVDRNNNIYNIRDYQQVCLETKPLNRQLTQNNDLINKLNDKTLFSSWNWGVCYESPLTSKKYLYQIESIQSQPYHLKAYLTDLGQTLSAQTSLKQKDLAHLALKHNFHLTTRKNILNLTTKKYQNQILTDLYLSDQQEFICHYHDYNPDEYLILRDFDQFLTEVKQQN